MRKLFDEYSTLLLCFVCSIIGFELLYKMFASGSIIHNAINHILYGTL